MDRQQLRERQAPIKELYRAEPESATIVLRAKGTLDGEDIVCSVETGRALVAAGLHPGTGGDEFHACSGDMLLQALAACAGVTLRSVATSMELSVTGTVEVEGDLDFRGTLGIDREAPVGFQAIRLAFKLQSDATEEQLDTLIKQTERYCVVYQTLLGGVTVDVTCSATG
jgi:uncharacterized OsmC-like protein